LHKPKYDLINGSPEQRQMAKTGYW